MLEPPAHSGAFRQSEILQIAAQLLKKAPKPDYGAECAYLVPGKLTLLRGPSNTERSRFAMGLVCGLTESTHSKPPGPVLCFNRRWLSGEAIRMLLQHEVGRHLRRHDGNHEEAMIQAVEHIQSSGFAYETQCRTVEAICAKVREQQALQPARCIVVDGLEHFNPEGAGDSHSPNRSEQLIQLKQLARTNALPILATCPSLPEAKNHGAPEEADYSIYLRRNA